MPRINTNIGINAGIGGSSSGVANWTPQSPLGGEVANYSATGDRTGLVIPEVNGNDIQILPAIYRGNGSVYYKSSSPNGRDFLTSDDWVINFDVVIDVVPTGSRCLFTTAADDVSLTIQPTANRWSFVCQTGYGGQRSFLISGAVLPLATREYNFKIVHDKSGSTTVWESGNNVGSSNAIFTNTSLAQFYTGAASDGSLSIDSGVCIKALSIYTDLAETTLKVKYIFTGGKYEYDLGGNTNYELNTFIAAAPGYNLAIKGYSVLGSTFLMENGFSIYQKTGQYDEYLATGAVDTSLVAAGYTLTATIPESLTKYNLAPALLDLNYGELAVSALDIFDRSNVTIQTIVSRESIYYNVTHPNRYHPSELSVEVLQSYFEPDYQWKVFPKLSPNSIHRDESITLLELFAFATQKSTTDKEKALHYTGDYNLFYGYEYKFDDLFLAAVNNNKVLRFDETNLDLSTDGGVNYGTKLDVSGDCPVISSAWIFNNGNIWWSSNKKCFVSTDSLATYHEIVVRDINGDAYTAPSNEAFTVFYEYERFYDQGNGNEILFLAQYTSNDAPTGQQSVDLNIWCSTDNGLTLKSIYKYNTASPTFIARHIHSINFCPYDHKFYVMTEGAMAGVLNSAKWHRFSFVNGVATFEDILEESSGVNYKTVGMVFYNNYVYWAIDLGYPIWGAYRQRIADLGNIALIEPVDFDAYQNFGFAGDTTGLIMMPSGSENKLITISVDGGKHFVRRKNIGGLPVMYNSTYINRQKEKTNLGWYILAQNLQNAPFPNISGEVLMFKIDRNNINPPFVAANTSYDNVGGKGDRSATIAVTTTFNITGALSKFVNGVTAGVTDLSFNNETTSTKYINFDFGVGARKIINEIKFYQNNTTGQGTSWWLQGSNEESATPLAAGFADICEGTINLGGVATQTITAPALNKAAFRHYRLLGAGGSVSNLAYLYEFEFKIVDE